MVEAKPTGHRLASSAMRLRLVPITLAQARAFVAGHHRHSAPPHRWRFGVGAAVDDKLVGVAVAADPTARLLAGVGVLEVTRLSTDGTENAASFLYGAIARAAKSLGYTTLYTYTLAHESGASLRASGWVVDDPCVPDRGWDMPGRQRRETDEWGNPLRPSGPRVRWVKHLAEPGPQVAVTAGYDYGARWRRCEACRRRFPQGRTDARFCSSPCRQKAWRSRQASTA